jgi:plastocyanin
VTRSWKELAVSLLLGAALAWAARLGISAPASDATGEIRASVTLLGPDRKKVPAAGTVLWISDVPGERAAAGARPKIASKSKRFDPRITIVPAGTTVDFPNLDNIFHNVFSLSEKARFDLGLYRNGAFRSMTFDNSGLVRIYCNIHPQMAGYIVVVDGQLYGQTGPEGTATIAGIRPGKRTLRVWDEKGGERTETVDVVSGRPSPVAIVLDGSSWREVPHKNKYGKDYPPPDDDENRY